MADISYISGQEHLISQALIPSFVLVQHYHTEMKTGWKDCHPIKHIVLTPNHKTYY